MGLRTPDQYLESLRDGRAVYFQGERVPDVTAHPVIGTACRHAAIDYEMAEQADYRDLATVQDPESGRTISRYYQIPRSPEDLLKRSELIATSTKLGATLVCLIKEIGTDALLGLQIVTRQIDREMGTNYYERVRAFYEYCRDNDLALAVAQTDVKGDRTKGPSDQPNPDYYVHVVEERADGIVVRGAKVHTSVSTNANEIIVLPTRAMGPKDKDYAVAFALPADTPGLKLIASPYGASGTGKSEFDFPISARHKMMETLTVFDDVFVPKDRVFLKGEIQFAGPVALGFVEFHRYTAISYKIPLVDLLVGAAQLIADYNGIERAPHVRDKITWLIAYAETLKALIRQAALDCKYVDGIAVPKTMIVNMAKYHFAHNYHEAIRQVQDLSGGLLVTQPGEADLNSPEIGQYVRHYLGGREGVSAEDRLRVLNLISDLTAGEYGGYQEVLAVHAEGSLEAEKMMVLREYRSTEAKDYARQLAGVDQSAAVPGREARSASPGELVRAGQDGPELTAG